MNKLIDGLFEKDSVIRVISILTAVLIWFLVLDQDNPFEERTLAIPLSSNVEVLQANNLQIVGTPLPTSIDIKIRGRKNKISGITSNDFKANIDLSGVKDSGISTIRIDTPQYLGDQDVIISSINPSSVTLRFERIIGKQYPVNVEFSGKLPAGYELLNLKVEPNNVILEEKESSISRVSKVVAIINLDDIKDNKEIIMRGTVLDNEGQPLRQFEGKVPVIVTFDLAKRVPIAAVTKGIPLQDWYFSEIKYSSDTVRLIGPKSVLDSINSLVAADIDITGKSDVFKTPLVLTAPKGTTLYKDDIDDLTAEVVLNKLVTRNINVPSSAVSIYGGDATGNMGYRINTETIPITVKGRPENFNSLRIGDIRLSITVGGLEPGDHEVPLIVQVPSGLTLIGEYSVNITIAEGTPPSPQG